MKIVIKELIAIVRSKSLDRKGQTPLDGPNCTHHRATFLTKHRSVFCPTSKYIRHCQGVYKKYCDLIPIERYVQMARRGGLLDLPPNTLIDLTHQFAFFVSQVYRKIGEGVMQARVLRADEVMCDETSSKPRRSIPRLFSTWIIITKFIS